MTTTAPLGVVSLLGGIVLALTSLSTKNFPHATVVIGGLLQCLRSSTSKVFDEAFAALVSFLALGATKLGNDDTLQSPYRVVDANCV
uniref:SLC26A/SulP transporter domain-containing protein n=1 Tax=Oryza glumipatula TaxID=40148 RepID=A0A0D9YDJ2_9ORYZ